MKQLLSITFLLISLVVTLRAQCPDYHRILQNIERTYHADQLDSALLQVRFLRACTPKDDALAEEWTDKIFKRINQQKAEAKAAQRNAENSEKIAKAAQKKAERLTTHFHFGNENAAWAYYNGRFAVIDRDGNQLTDYIYETPDSFSNGIALAQVNGQYAFMGEKGKELSKRYDFVIQTADDFYYVGTGVEWKYPKEEEWMKVTEGRKKTGKIDPVRLEGFKRFTRLNKHLFLALDRDTNWVWLNDKGQQTGTSQFHLVGWGRGEGLLAVQTGKDSLWGFIDTFGRMAITPRFKEVRWFSEGLAGARQDSLWGFIDKTGNWVIRPQFFEIRNFKSGAAEVSKDKIDYFRGNQVFIDKTGKVIFPSFGIRATFYLRQSNGLVWVNRVGKIVLADSTGMAFDSLSGYNSVSYGGGRMIVRKHDGSWVFADTSGCVVRMPKYEGIDHLGDKLFGVSKDGQWVFADTLDVLKNETQRWKEVGMYTNTIIRVKENNVWGFIDSSGQLITKPQFEDVGVFNNGFTKVMKDSLWGFVNTSGQLIIKPQFEAVEDFVNGIVRVMKDSLWGFVDTSGQLIIKPQFEEAGDFENRFARVMKDSLWGFVNTSGQLMMEPQFEEVRDFEQGLARVRKDSLWGFVDANGQFIIKPQFEEVLGFENGLARVREDNLWGFVDTSGQLILKPQFEEVLGFENGLASVRKDSLWGFVGTSGQFVIKPQFEGVRGFVNGLAGVMKDSLWGLMDTAGNLVVPPQFAQILHIGNNLVAIKKDSLWGVFDTKKGAIVSPPQFNEIEWWNPFEGGFVVQKNGLEGLIDDTGLLVLPAEFYSIQTWGFGLVGVKKDKLWGVFSTRSNKMILPPQFDDLDMWNASVYGFGFEKNRLNGRIDTSGRIVIAPEYDDIGDFENGYAIVQKSGKSGLINTDYQLVLRCDYNALHRSSLHSFLTEQNGRYGLFNVKHNIHIPAEYEAFGLLGEASGWIRAKKNGKWGWVDRRGQVMIPFRYDAVMPFEKGQAWVRQEPYPRFFKINMGGKMIQE